MPYFAAEFRTKTNYKPKKWGQHLKHCTRKMKKLNKAQANQIANIWNTLHAGVTEETKTIALVVENSIKGYDVEVHNVGEKNRKTAFYHSESLVNICATFNCSNYIRYWDGEVYAVIY